MNRQLSEIGNVPVMTSVIESLYPELKSPDKKVEEKSLCGQSGAFWKDPFV